MSARIALVGGDLFAVVTVSEMVIQLMNVDIVLLVSSMVGRE